MTKQIKMSTGKIVLVDDEDFEELNQYKWCCMDGYAARTSSRKIPGRPVIVMHRIIMNAPKGMMVDHINHNKLDNRKENLRVCTNSENQRNRGIPLNNSSGYKGVSKMNKKWMAQLHVGNKTIYLGVFPTPELASQAYEDKCKEVYGEFHFQQEMQ